MLLMLLENCLDDQSETHVQLSFEGTTIDLPIDVSFNVEFT